jgi:hypothetical protein
MNISKKQYYIIFLAFVSLILFNLLFFWINYLVENKYIVEGFEENSNKSDNSTSSNSTTGNTSNNSETVCVPKNRIKEDGNNYVLESSLTSHTVDMPLTTKYSCNNFCGPPSRCSITGDQCTSDVDCPGCLPYEPKKTEKVVNIPGDNDAGKLTFNITPTYSSLTTDIGTRARLVTNDKFSKPAMPDFGVNTWKSSFDEDTKEFNNVYKPNKLENMPNYKNRYSLSGEFIDEGPLPSNAYLS